MPGCDINYGTPCTDQSSPVLHLTKPHLTRPAVPRAPSRLMATSLHDLSRPPMTSLQPRPARVKARPAALASSSRRQRGPLVSGTESESGSESGRHAAIYGSLRRGGRSVGVSTGRRTRRVVRNRWRADHAGDRSRANTPAVRRNTRPPPADRRPPPTAYRPPPTAHRPPPTVRRVTRAGVARTVCSGRGRRAMGAGQWRGGGR